MCSYRQMYDPKTHAHAFQIHMRMHEAQMDAKQSATYQPRLIFDQPRSQRQGTLAVAMPLPLARLGSPLQDAAAVCPPGACVCVRERERECVYFDVNMFVYV